LEKAPFDAPVLSPVGGPPKEGDFYEETGHQLMSSEPIRLKAGLRTVGSPGFSRFIGL